MGIPAKICNSALFFVSFPPVRLTLPPSLSRRLLSHPPHQAPPCELASAESGPEDVAAHCFRSTGVPLRVVRLVRESGVVDRADAAALGVQGIDIVHKHPDATVQFKNVGYSMTTQHLDEVDSIYLNY